MRNSNGYRRILTILLLLAAAAQAANQYETAALAEARKQGLSSSQVAAKSYAAIAALAGVNLGPKGESPAKFFYVNVRRHVVSVLAPEEKAARIEARRLEVRAKLRELFPDADIGLSEDGKMFTITNLKPDPQEVTP